MLGVLEAGSPRGRHMRAERFNKAAATCTMPLGVDDRRTERAGVGSELGVSCTGYPSISRILACTALCLPHVTGLASYMGLGSYAALLCPTTSQRPCCNSRLVSSDTHTALLQPVSSCTASASAVITGKAVIPFWIDWRRPAIPEENDRCSPALERSWEAQQCCAHCAP